jgi:hypothetical protein
MKASNFPHLFESDFFQNFKMDLLRITKLIFTQKYIPVFLSPPPFPQMFDTLLYFRVTKIVSHFWSIVFSNLHFYIVRAKK